MAEGHNEISRLYQRSLITGSQQLRDAEEYGNGLIDLAYALEQYEEYEAGYQEVEQAITEQNDAEAATERTEESTTVAEQEEETDTVASGTELTEEMLIEENESPVETFEEVDYVEGRWGKDEHEMIVDGAKDRLKETGVVMSATDIAVFKRGAVYPDQVFPVTFDNRNKIWHGGTPTQINYVANYINATQIVRSAGKPGKAAAVCQESTEAFDLMKYQINDKRITYQIDSAKSGVLVGTRTWDEIIGWEYKYASDDNERVRLKKVFLYGMASHILADAYAHSAYCRCNGSLMKISTAHGKGQEDERDVHKERFVNVKEAMFRVLAACHYQTLGNELDFAPLIWGQDEKYYMKNIIKHADKAKINYSYSTIYNAYWAINC